jgi:hypothetical protein
MQSQTLEGPSVVFLKDVKLLLEDIRDLLQDLVEGEHDMEDVDSDEEYVPVPETPVLGTRKRIRGE